MNRIVILMLLVLGISCKTNSSLESKKIFNEDFNVVAIKYMGTVHTSPMAIYEDSFWEFKEEHALIKISKKYNFIERVEKLEESDGKKVGDIKYAFLINKENVVDTIYSDHTLNGWIFTDNGKTTYRYDSSGDFSFQLKERYSFFNECW